MASPRPSQTRPNQARPGRAGPPTSAAGFTLAEMLAALAILLFGITALLGALTSSVAQRRTADARLETTALCEQAMQRLQEEAVRLRKDATSDLDLELVPLQDQTSPDFPGMRWSATAVVDEDRPDVWMVRLQVHWLEDSEDVSEEFLRVLPRQQPLRLRVQRFQEQSNETPEK